MLNFRSSSHIFVKLNRGPFEKLKRLASYHNQPHKLNRILESELN
ncbi:hypothetical protein LEP1GSC008_2914 [Leptospira kirschneri serovar Bulgarica str. Nikolaevo]|uniref:Uncharacterized protein n=1 Tax=Leptospira kirschneri serovar Bulgarica str. Nikolaevo TaxID=1240687 RepID=M6F6T7_9LEPT|nr:hypothetical protein LEP1GSC008_2914 [Leptospira kirschneri serovar Bulgarica str. Nikolaevo]